MHKAFGAESVTFGAVVLTLKATGCEFWFVIVKERLTTCVRGPVTEVRDDGGVGWRTYV